MTPEKVIREMIDSRIITETDDGTLEFTKQFQESVQREYERVDRSTQTKIYAELDRKAADGISESLQNIDGENTDIISIIFATNNYELDLDSHGIFLLLITQMYRGFPPSEGVPDGFFPLEGQLLNVFIKSIKKAIVYVWREDCPPCDTLCACFEDLIDDSDVEVCRIAVYGPNCARLLQQEYDVACGPTTLFFSHGSVTSRFVGVPSKSALENEIEYLEELESSPLQSSEME